MTENALKQLQEGVSIRVNKKTHHTLPAEVHILEKNPKIEDRDPPIRYRANIPTTWLELTLTEGKNRQVRRMCAAVDFPVLRLIRASMGRLKLEGIPRGGFIEIESSTILAAFDF